MNKPDPALVSSLSGGLFWLRRELEATLTKLRSALEQYLEGAEDSALLNAVAEGLQILRGTLSTAQCFGAALLASEMSLLLQALRERPAGGQDEAWSALSGATLQLSDYLDLITPGEPDRALLLHAVLNELRKARGQSPFSEAELFVLQARAEGCTFVLPVEHEPPAAATAAAQTQARLELPGFQSAFLQWFRGAGGAEPLARMGRTADTIAGLVADASLRTIWLACAALAEALQATPTTDSLDLKRLFGRAGSQLKLLADAGEHAAAAQTGDLVHLLLFQLSRAAEPGERGRQLLDQLDVESLLPNPATLVALRRRLRAPGSSTLARLHAEIRSDFTGIKDAIDLAIRTGDRAPLDRANTSERLGRLATTLSALGLSAAPPVLIDQARRLESSAPDAPAWIEVATAILRVEHGLEDELFLALGQSGGVGNRAETGAPQAQDLRESIQALLRATLVNLAQFKSGIEQFLKDSDHAALAAAPNLLHEIAAGLRMLGETAAARRVLQLEHYVADGALERRQAAHGGHEDFADAVACVEVHLEALRDGLPNPAGIVAALARHIERLDFMPVPEVSPIPAESSPSPSPSPSPSEPPAVSAAADEVDPEIRDIFVGEAGEVLEQLRRSYSSLRRDPGNREALTSLRRAFHTLKGSGRMVGAARVGEFGWALERLLNRCLDDAVPPAPEVFAVVGEAIELLPGLIGHFCGVGEESPAVVPLMARADALAEGQVSAAEPDVRSVFCEDARARLAGVQRWLESQDPAESDVEPAGEVIRAFHTLRGSAAVVNAVAVSRLSASLENWLNALRLQDRRLSTQGHALLADVVPDLLGWVEALARDTPVDEAAADSWQQRIEALDAPVAADAVPAVDGDFALAALDALQAIEVQAQIWAVQPTRGEFAEALHQRCVQLADSAAAAGCTSLRLLTQALGERLAAWLTPDSNPEPGFFASLLEIIEALYQQLDLYREGGLHAGADEVPQASTAAWLERINWLPQPVLSLPVVDEAFVSDPPVSMPEPVLDAEPLQVTEVPAISELRPASNTSHFPPAIAVEEDSELLEVFGGEAAELLEALHHNHSLWMRSPAAGDALTELRRGLHTLKGSARTAGIPAMGTVAHRLESLLDATLDAAQVARIGQQLAVGFNGLQFQCDALRRGEFLPAEPILADVDAAGLSALSRADVAVAEPESVSLEDIGEVITLAEPADDEPLEFLPVEPLPASSISSHFPAAEESGEPADFDVELGDIFSAEAAELLEALDAGFEAWQNGDAAEPVLEIQRALHTLKGGARMAGITAMGQAAHELESKVNAAVASGEFPDAARFEQLRAQLEILHRMHDQIRRGEAQLLTTSLPSDVPPVAAARPAESPGTAWAPALFWQPENDAAGQAAARPETARVPVELLDAMLNEAGEISIYRSRLEEHNTALRTQLNEMVQTVTRVREQLRMMDIETEAQIAARGLTGNAPAGSDQYAQDFDPLEMDRYSRMQELSRALAESINDLGSLQATMDEAVSASETLLQQQSRINSEVQQSLMGTLMVPFSRQVQRLLRVVRQTAQENGKQADLQFVGAEAELDRKVLERMTAPLEHLLRNAVVHGIETPAARLASGKPEAGLIQVQLRREGSQLLVDVSDDGGGLDFSAIHRKAVERGMIAAGAELSNDALARFIFEPGFSTARQLTQDAGRGIGMDVVASEVKQLGGTLDLRSDYGRGTRFLIRLPLTLAVSQALLVQVGPETYAVPLPSIEGIARIPRGELADYYHEEGPLFFYAERGYRVRYLGDYLGLPRPLTGESRSLSLILLRLGEGLTAQGERRVALVVDQLIGNREIISKAAGPQISALPGVAGATILADGRVVLILDPPAMVADAARRALLSEVSRRVEAPAAEVRDTIMVVDDSITMRRVAERLLLRQGYQVITAKDGLDAIALLQTEKPAAVLLDIEMPRADGFEVAAFIRNSPRLRGLPIIMITSRSGEKHRERARSLGVDRYLIKPYQEDQLLAEVNAVRGRPS